MDQVLGIVYCCVATHLSKTVGFSRKVAQNGAITLTQGFGSALNLNIHFQMLFVDGAYVERPDGALPSRWLMAPTGVEFTWLAQILSLRISRYLNLQRLLKCAREQLTAMSASSMNRPIREPRPDQHSMVEMRPLTGPPTDTQIRPRAHDRTSRCTCPSIVA